MAVAIDASSPAIAAQLGSSATTASFNPPDNAVLVAVVFGTDSATMSNNGGALTWTSRKEDGIGSSLEIFTAPLPTGRTGMTVTATGGGGEIALKVYVITGGDLSSPVGATGNGTSAVNNPTVTGYTSTFAGSRGICGAFDQSGRGMPTSTDDESAYSLVSAGMGVAKAANTATAGTAVTFNLDAASTSGGTWYWVAVEVKPLQVITISPSSVDAAASVPAPSVSAGATVSPGTVDAASSISAPSVTAGATASPDAVDAVAIIPSVSITTGDVEIIIPTTVDAVAVIPTPAVSTGQTVPAATVEAVAVIPAPAVSVGVTLTPATVLARAVIPIPLVSVPVLPGETIDGPGQIEFGGVRWGGNSFRVQEITGWESRPSLDNLNENRPSRHGAWAGRKLAQQRLVTIKLLVDSFADPTLVDDALDELAWATRILDDDSQLSLVIKGYGEPLLAYGAVADYDVAWDGDYSVGAPVVSVLIACPDPLKYSLTQQSVVVPAGGSALATNSGNTATPPRIRITGPAENLVLTNITLDRILAFDVQVEGGQRLDIDTQLGTVTIGSTDRRSSLAALSVPIEDFMLGAGVNELAFDVDSGGSSGAEFLFRSAKL